MRKILIAFFVVIVTISILWIIAGQQVVLFVDQFGTIESEARTIHIIAYEGSGDDGALVLGRQPFPLGPADSHSRSPHIGTTKDNQLALASAGKVFPFGMLQSGSTLASDVPSGDTASLVFRHSALSSPILFVSSDYWGRYQYYELIWKKQNGAKLEMTWRYEQHFLQTIGWTRELIHGQGDPSTGLIRVEISDNAR